MVRAVTSVEADVVGVVVGVVVVVVDVAVEVVVDVEVVFSIHSVKVHYNMGLNSSTGFDKYQIIKANSIYLPVSIPGLFVKWGTRHLRGEGIWDA